MPKIRPAFAKSAKSVNPSKSKISKLNFENANSFFSNLDICWDFNPHFYGSDSGVILVLSLVNVLKQKPLPVALPWMITENSWRISFAFNLHKCTLCHVYLMVILNEKYSIIIRLLCVEIYCLWFGHSCSCYLIGKKSVCMLFSDLIFTWAWNLTENQSSCCCMYVFNCMSAH